MARPKAEMAGPRHPARKILAEHTAQEIGDALGIKATSVYPLKNKLTQTKADAIVEAFKTVAAPKEKVPKNTQKVNTVSADGFLRQVEEQQKVADAESLARNAIANVAKTELLPALGELVGRLNSNKQPAAYLVVPLTQGDLKKLRGDQ